VKTTIVLIFFVHPEEVEVSQTRGAIDLEHALKLPHLVRTGQFNLRRRVDPKTARIQPPVDYDREKTCRFNSVSQ
jgi:hypothetical protein